MSSKSRQQRVRSIERRTGRKLDFDAPIEPVVIDARLVPQLDNIHVFTVLDDDGAGGEKATDYYMPGYVSPALTLRVLEVIELRGYEAGLSYALHEMLGDEGHTALKNCEALTPKMLEDVTAIVMKRVMGALDTGN